jgi:hypothetical protein
MSTSPRALARAGQVVGALLTLLPLLSPGGARADCVCNCDCRCPANCTDFEVIYTTTNGQPIHLTAIYTGISDQATNTNGTMSFPPGNQAVLPAHGLFLQVVGNTVYNPPYSSPPTSAPPPTTPYNLIQVSGNDSTRVMVTFHTDPTSSQPVIPAGDWTHVGIFGSGRGRMVDSFWTSNGVPVNSSQGHMPGVVFQGSSSNWLVERVTLYDAFGNPIGHEWVEDQATGFSLVGSGVDLYYSTATLISPTEIPLDQLNNELPGFGPESPVQVLAASVPEPASVLLLGVGASGLFVYGWRRRKAGHA